MAVWLGLTGSIGMGKSSTAKLFAAEGCAVWDADAAVHRLYAKGGAAVEPMARAFPAAVVNGEVSRQKLKDILSQRPESLKKIEAIVHPLVAKDRSSFAEQARADVLADETITTADDSTLTAAQANNKIKARQFLGHVVWPEPCALKNARLNGEARSVGRQIEVAKLKRRENL